MQHFVSPPHLTLIGGAVYSRRVLTRLWALGDQGSVAAYVEHKDSL
jgi:hypothetical protein